MISFIHRLEKTMGRQHPVGMTVPWAPGRPGGNEELFRSPAEWVSPNPAARNGYSYKYDPPPADGGKIVLLDTDHLITLYSWILTTAVTPRAGSQA
jgi:hypothetical protein